jgi:DNA-binding transcriptional ArsR family regulator
VLLSLLEESYPREIARLLRVPVSGVQGALRVLERDSLVSGRLVGRSRLYRINPRYFAARELTGYLNKLSAVEPDLVEIASSLRKRPRRAGKPL